MRRLLGTRVLVCVATFAHSVVAIYLAGENWQTASDSSQGAAGSHLIYPDRHWNDTKGRRIEAHAAGMLQSPLDGRWYWYGETRKMDDNPGVNCYSAPTLAGPWQFEGEVVVYSQIAVAGYAGPFIVERPKVIYNDATRRFVMWFHLDSPRYSYRLVGVAQSSAATSGFEFVHAMRPDGIPSLDMSLFKDPVDGQAYFIRSCNNEYTAISRLSSDYLNSTGIISRHSVYEGMAMLRHPNGTYYMIASHLTGWDPNPLMILRAEGETLDDPRWVNLGNPTSDPTSFNSQPTYVVQYTPKSGKMYFIYMADDWVHCGGKELTEIEYPVNGTNYEATMLQVLRGNFHRKPLEQPIGQSHPEMELDLLDTSTADALRDACYIWLPIRFDDGPAGGVSIRKRSVWDMEHPFEEDDSTVETHPF